MKLPLKVPVVSRRGPGSKWIVYCAPEATGSRIVSVIARDTTQAIDVQSFTLTIDPAGQAGANQPPRLGTLPSGRIQVDQPWIHRLDVADPEGQPLTFAIVSVPDGVSIDGGGLLTWTPTFDQLGPQSFTLRASDGVAADDLLVSFAITVTTEPANRPPTLLGVDLPTAMVGRLYQHAVSGRDPDGDTISYQAIGAPAGLQVHPNTGLVQWAPDQSQIGSHTFTISITDPRGGGDSRRVTIDVLPANRPAIGQPITRTTAPINQTYIYAVSASDADGHAVRFSLGPNTTAQASGPISIDPDTGLIHWTPAVLGPFVIEVVVVDELGDGMSIRNNIRVSDPVAERPNAAPVITSTPPPRVKIGDTVVYQLTGYDPDGEAITFSMPTPSPRPANVQFDEATGTLTWVPPQSQLRQQVPFEFRVTDERGRYAFQNVWIGVTQNGNFAPEIAPIGDVTLDAGDRLRVDISASDGNLDALAFSLDQASLDRGVTIDEYGRIVWQTSIDDLSETAYPITVYADDTIIKGERTFHVSVIVDTEPPVVTLTPDRTAIAVGDRLRLQLFTTDNVGVASRSIRIVSATDADGQTTTLDQVVAVSSGGVAIVPITAAMSGTLTYLADATDRSGNRGETTLAVEVIDYADSGRPQIDLATPLNQSAGGPIRLDRPTDVVGTISDDSGLLEIVVQLRSEVDDEWTTLFSQSGTIGQPLENFTGELATIDTTNLPNGDYSLRVSASDVVGNVTTRSYSLTIEADLKLGNLAIAVTDVSVPFLSGTLPVVRRYDSLAPRRPASQRQTTQSLAPGWTISIPAAGLDYYPVSNERSLFSDNAPLRRGDRVTFMHIDGRTESWTFRPQPAPGFLPGNSYPPIYEIAWQPDPGTTSTLISPTGQLYDMQGEFFTGQNLGTRSYSLLDRQNGALKVQTRSGLVYEMPSGSGDARSITTADGDTILLGRDGFTASNGAEVRFERDPAGRLISIVDPLGDRVRYSYDALGRLASFTDRTGRRESYEYGGDGNRLTGVLDADGNRLAQYEYDPEDGRLSIIVDADGRRVETRTDEESFTETVIDAYGNTSETQYDLRGNPIRSVAADGGVTTRVFSGDKYLTSETDPLGRTTTYAYNSAGQITRQTDPLGNATSWTYFPDGTVQSVTDAAGNSTVTTVSRYYGGLKYYPMASGRQVTETRTTTDPVGDSVTLAHQFQEGVSAREEFTLTTPSGYQTYSNLVQLNLGGSGESAFWKFGFTYEGTSSAGAELSNITTNAFGETLTETVLGLTTSYTRDREGRLTQVTAPGGTSGNQYDALGRLIATTDALGRRTQRVYDRSGNLIAQLLPDETPGDDTDNLRRAFAYDLAGRLASETDERGFTTKYVYDAAGRVTQTILPDLTPEDDSDNPTTGSRFDLAGQLIASVDRFGNETTYKYDAVGRVVETISSLGDVTRTVYDDVGRDLATTYVTSTGLHRGVINRYDAAGRRTRSEFYDELEISLTVDASGIASTVLVPPTGQPTAWNGMTFEFGLMKSETDSVAGTTTYDYNARGNVTSVTDPEGAVTGYQYDGRGNLDVVMDAAGNETRFTFNDLNQIESTTFADGTVVRSVYDSVGRLLAEIDQLDRRTDYEYDFDGNLVATILPAIPDYLAEPVDDGSGDWAYPLVRPRYGYDYDALGNLETFTDPLGRQTRFTYDAFGNQLTRTLPTGEIESTAYDSLGRVRSATNLAGVVSQYVYDDTADNRGRVAEMLMFGSTADHAAFLLDPSLRYAADRVTYGVDDQLRPITTTLEPSQTPAGPLAGLVGSARTAIGGVYTTDYDSLGRVLAEIGPTGIVAYQYDDQTDQLIATSTFAAGSDYLLDAPLDVTTNDYDTFGRLTAVTVTRRHGADLSVPEETHYHYDLRGNLRREDHSNGIVIDRLFDELGRLETQTSYAPDATPDDLSDNDKLAQFSHQYFDDGQLAQTIETFWTEPDLTQMGPHIRIERENIYSYQYDDGGRLIYEDLDHSNDTFDFSAEYILDLVGNRLQRSTDRGRDGIVDEVIRSSYDAADRLTQSITDNGDDGIDDIMTTYAYQGGQQVGQRTVEIDTGFVLEERVNTYSRSGQLESVALTRRDADTRQVEAIDNVAYGYDAGGLRTVRIGQSDTNGDESLDRFTTETFLFDSSSPTGYAEVVRHVVVDTNTDAVLSETHFTLGFDAVAQSTDGEATEQLLTDTSGHVRSVTGIDGLIAALTPISTFDSFGFQIDRADPVSSLGYRGQWTDAATGEQFLRARWYDPSSGRFGTADPSSPYFSSIDSNQYLYGGGNPVGNYDPTGLFTVSTSLGSISISGSLSGLSNSASTAALSAAQSGGFAAAIATALGDDPVEAFLVGFYDGAKESLISAIPYVGTVYNIYDTIQTVGALTSLVDVLLIQRYLSGDDIEDAFQQASAEVNAAAAAVGGVDVGQLLAVSGGAAIAALTLIATTKPQFVTKLLKTPVFAKLKSKASINKQQSEINNILDSCNSFTHDTRVLLADGSTKAISEIEEGDLVLGHDPETGETSAEAVLNVIYGFGHKDLVELTFADGAILVATANHPFWDEESDRWVDAESLQPGDLLLDADGTTIVLVGTYAYQSPDQAAYNLTVDSVHTYFVVPGEAAVLVHNSSCSVLNGFPRVKPRLDSGNSKEGWQHIYERHISGSSAGPLTDLFAPGTTRAEIEEAATHLVQKGVRLSNPSKNIQTYERRMTIHGKYARFRVVVDSQDGNRIITMFPAEGGS